MHQLTRLWTTSRVARSLCGSGVPCSSYSANKHRRTDRHGSKYYPLVAKVLRGDSDKFMRCRGETKKENDDYECQQFMSELIMRSLWRHWKSNNSISNRRFVVCEFVCNVLFSWTFWSALVTRFITVNCRNESMQSQQKMHYAT